MYLILVKRGQRWYSYGLPYDDCADAEAAAAELELPTLIRYSRIVERY